MVELANSTDVPGVDQVTSGVARMLDAGVDKAELLSMFQTIVDQHEAASSDVVAPNNYDENTVFTELPEGLIDVSTATKKYQLSRMTLNNWIRRGHLVPQGRLKAPARGGGYWVVDEAALVRCMATPTRMGRPPKE